MKDLYLQDRKDGSQFGSRAGSQAGSLTKTIAASEKVRGFLKSTTNDISERIIEEGEGDIPKAAARKPTDAENIIKNFPMSDSDSIRLKSEAAKQEALQLENKKKEAKAVYGRQKGLVAKMCNHFLNNADKQDWEVRDYNVRLATHIAKMQSHFMFYLSYVVNDAEEQAARDEFNPRLIKANEILGLANALAQIEENVAKKQAEADVATTQAQAKTSEDVTTTITTAPQLNPSVTVSVQPQLSTAGTDYASLDFSEGAFAASFPTSTATWAPQASTSGATSVPTFMGGTPYTSFDFGAAAWNAFVTPAVTTITSTTTTFLSTLASSRPITSAKIAATTSTSTRNPQAYSSFDLRRRELPEWLSKPLPELPAEKMTKPTFVKTPLPKITDVGSDRSADLREEQPPTGRNSPTQQANGNGRGKGKFPPKQKDNFRKPP